MANYFSTHTGTQHDTYVTNSDLINLIYPVGAIYISTVATNPGTLFGVGTWTQIQDRFLLCAGTTYTGGATGGAATINLQHSHSTNAGTTGGPSNNTSGGPSNNTSGSTAITIAQMPSHNHNSRSLTGTFQGNFQWLNDNGWVASGSNGIASWNCNSNGEYFSPTGWNTAKGGRHPGGVTINATHTHDSQGSGQGHTHTLSSHTHTLSSHTHSQVSVGTNNQLSTAQSILPPYIAVYVWQRTA